MHWLLAVVTVGAVYRITRLINADRITLPIRERVYARDIAAGRVDDDGLADGPLSYLIACPWCVSLYVTWPITAAAVLWPTNRAVWVILVGLTASAAAGLIARADV